MALTDDPQTASSSQPDSLSRIAVGIDGYPEGRDAAVLAAMIAGVTGAELMLVAVHPDPLVVLPRELGWAGMHEQAQALLRETRDALAPNARIDVETDFSVPRALERVVAREHRDLLVVGSSRKGPEGRVRIGTRTRQLLGHCRCALAVAPRGYAAAAKRQIRQVGVGYEGSSESRAALSLAASVALAASAKLQVRAVLDDRLPTVGWSRANREAVLEIWDEMLEPQVHALRQDAQDAAAATGAAAEVKTLPGAPPRALRELSDQVDLLVIGSRRWGATSRVLLGGTGETLMHDAGCPVLVAPRPAA